MIAPSYNTVLPYDEKENYHGYEYQREERISEGPC